MIQAAVQRQANRTIWIGPAIIIVAHAALFGGLDGLSSAFAALFGSLIVIINNLMQVWQLKRADRIAGREAGNNLRYLYRCTLERYVVTVALFAAGIGALKLAALPLISGFIIAHVAMVFRWFLESSLRRRRHG